MNLFEIFGACGFDINDNAFIACRCPFLPHVRVRRPELLSITQGMLALGSIFMSF